MSLLDDLGKNHTAVQDRGKVLIHGQPGTGKSTLVDSMKEVGPGLVLYVPGEEGINSYEQGHKNIRLHRLETPTELLDIRNALIRDKHDLKWIGIESTSAMVDWVGKSLLGLDLNQPVTIRPDSEFGFWGAIKTWFTEFFTHYYALASVREMGDKAVHVVMTSQTKALDDVEGNTMMQPDMPKGPLSAAMSRPDHILYTHMDDDPDDTDRQIRVVRVHPSDSVYAKVRGPRAVTEGIPEVLGYKKPLTLPAFLKAVQVSGLPTPSKTPSKTSKPRSSTRSASKTATPNTND